MDTILSILLFSDGLREIIIPQINDYRGKRYDPNDPNNIFTMKYYFSINLFLLCQINNNDENKLIYIYYYHHYSV